MYISVCVIYGLQCTLRYIITYLFIKKKNIQVYKINILTYVCVCVCDIIECIYVYRRYALATFDHHYAVILHNTLNNKYFFSSSYVRQLFGRLEILLFVHFFPFCYMCVLYVLTVKNYLFNINLYIFFVCARLAIFGISYLWECVQNYITFFNSKFMLLGGARNVPTLCFQSNICI